MMIPTAVPMTALADNAVNNSVSGYISADTGVKLIGKDKQAKIYVDSNDYELSLIQIYMAFNAQYDKTLVVGTDVRQRNICLSRNDDRRKTDARGGTQPIYTVAL